MPQTYPSNGPSSFAPGSPTFKPSWSPGPAFEPGAPANDNNLPVPANDNEIGRRPAMDKFKRFKRVGGALNYVDVARTLYLRFFADATGGLGVNMKGLQYWKSCLSGFPPTTFRWLQYYQDPPGVPPAGHTCIGFSSRPAPSSPATTIGNVFEIWAETGSVNGNPRFGILDCYWQPNPASGTKRWNTYAQPFLDPFYEPGAIPRPGFGVPWPSTMPEAGDGWPREGTSGGTKAGTGDAGTTTGVLVSPAVQVGVRPGGWKGLSTGDWPRREPPGRNTKERKQHVSIGGTPIGRILAGVTEAGDFENALWDALPRKYRSKLPKSYSAKMPRAFAPQGLDARVAWIKARDIYRHFDKIDIRKALLNVARNEAGDFIVGKANSKLRKAWRRNPYSYKGIVGPTTGPAL